MMSLLDVLFLQPLMVIYEAVFNFPGFLPVAWKIIAFSIVLNIVLTPVYRGMDLNARAGRERRSKVEADVARMKRHFRGRERYFYIRAVHRQYAYHPIQALLSSSELFVQILVFSTVYHFLSALP